MACARNDMQTGRTQYLPATNPVLVTTDSNGQPWVVDSPNNGGTLMMFDGQNWNDHIPLRQASSIVFDHDGNLWTDREQKVLSRFDGKNWTSFTSSNSGLVSDRITSIQVDHAGRVWIDYAMAAIPGTVARGPSFGVTVFDGDSWTTFNTGNSGIISNEVTAMAFDPENRAWFGTPRGISIFDGKTWSDYSPGNSGLVAGAISAIAFDREGRAWIGMLGDQKGINIFDGKVWLYHSLAELGFGGPELGMFGPEIFIDPSGRIWVQANGDIRIFDGGSWVGLAEEDGYGNNVYDLAADKQGNIWIANGNGRGLVAFDSEYPFALAWQTQMQRAFLSSGGIWYIVFILVCLFLASLRDSVIPVVLALLSGMAVFILSAVFLKDIRVVYFIPLMNPGIFATVSAMIRAFTGMWSAARTEKRISSRAIVIGFVIGLAIGLCQFLPWLFGQ